MGFMDRMKQSHNVGKNAQWRLGAKPAIVTLNDKYINIEYGGGEVNIFYKDIQQVEKRVMDIHIKTIADNYKLTTMRIKGGRDLADDLYKQLLDKVAEFK